MRASPCHCAECGLVTKGHVISEHLEADWDAAEHRIRELRRLAFYVIEATELHWTHPHCGARGDAELRGGLAVGQGLHLHLGAEGEARRWWSLQWAEAKVAGVEGQRRGRGEGLHGGAG